MKTTELKSIIRTIIQEELKEILPTLVPKVLAEILINNNKNIIPNNVVDNKYTTEESKPTQTTNKTYKKYTSNEVLNKVLNETTGGLPKEGSFVGLSNPMLDNTNANSFEIKSENLNESINETSPVAITKEQSKVLNLINRDFRSLLKAVDKKRKSGNLSSDIVQTE